MAEILINHEMYNKGISDFIWNISKIHFVETNEAQN